MTTKISPKDYCPTQAVAVVVDAICKHGEQGVTVKELEQLTGIPANRCRSILLGVSRVMPIYDDNTVRPAKWYLLPTPNWY